MFGRKPKIPNPEIKEFEKDLNQRGLLLVKGMFFNSSILIFDGTNFLQFAKRNGIKTIFKLDGKRYVYTNYFFIVNGVIVRTYFKAKVRGSGD